MEAIFYYFQVFTSILQGLPSSSPLTAESAYVRIILISTFIVYMQMYIPKVVLQKSFPKSTSLAEVFLSKSLSTDNKEIHLNPAWVLTTLNL